MGATGEFVGGKYRRRSSSGGGGLAAPAQQWEGVHPPDTCLRSHEIVLPADRRLTAAARRPPPLSGAGLGPLGSRSFGLGKRTG